MKFTRILITALAVSALATQALAQTPTWFEHFPATDPTPRAGLQGVSDGSKLYLYGGNSGATRQHSAALKSLYLIVPHNPMPR